MIGDLKPLTISLLHLIHKGVVRLKKSERKVCIQRKDDVSKCINKITLIKEVLAYRIIELTLKKCQNS